MRPDQREDLHRMQVAKKGESGMTDKCKSGDEPCPLDGSCPVQAIMEDPECDRVQIELAYYRGKAQGIREIQKLIYASANATEIDLEKFDGDEEAAVSA